MNKTPLERSPLPPKEGTKYDKDKLDYSQLPFTALEKVIRVLMYGSQKYSAFNWTMVPERTKRYMNAAYRHMSSFMKGEFIDPESGLEHLAHAVCSLLFILAESQDCDPNEQKWILEDDVP